MKKRLNRKNAIIIIAILTIILIGCIVMFNYIKNKERKLIKEIKLHYNSYIVITKDTNLYDKNGTKIGNVKKGFTFKLEDKNIKDNRDTYFRVKNTNYYIYYKDAKKTEMPDVTKYYDHYLVFNKNIKASSITFYDQAKEVLKIKDNINLPIKYMDDNYYYVVYLDRLLQVKKSDKVTVIDKENTKDKEADYISIIYYENIYGNEACNKDTCIRVDKVKEQLNYLKENNFYTVTLDEYNKWLDGKIHLKEKAILLIISNHNQNVINLNNEYSLKIETLPDNIALTFKDENKKTTRESKKDSLSRYNIKRITSIDDFKKMASGEEVKEVVIKQPTSIWGQGIPVLNYHFFYDESQGESCNENICLDVKAFREQLNYLKNNGYRTLTMEEFRKWMYGEMELPEKSVLITIDDGAMGTGAHNGNKLIPILEEYNMHATLFLISGWWDVNNYRSPNLDIQSHTYDMHQAGSCGKGQVVCSTKEEVIADLKKSLAIVDNNNSFCFPFYSYSDLSIEAVKEAGFKMSFIGGYRKATRNDDKYKIPRYPIHKTTTMQQFINMVN